jgi:hypothetical protein
MKKFAVVSRINGIETAEVVRAEDAEVVDRIARTNYQVVSKITECASKHLERSALDSGNTFL